MDLTPRFKLVFTSVLFLTVASLGVAVSLVSQFGASEETRPVIEACLSTFKMGFGALVGLLGGKVL